MAKRSRTLHPALKAQSQAVKLISAQYKKQGKKFNIGKISKEAAALVRSGKLSKKSRSHKKSMSPKKSHKKSKSPKKRSHKKSRKN